MIRTIITALATAVALFSVGARTTPDSLHYLSAADNLSGGQWLPDTYLSWPPLYPGLLALSGGHAAYLNGTLLALLIAGVAVLFRYNSLRVWFIVVAVAAFARPIQLIYGFVWSEAPFIVLVTAFLVVWTRYLHSRSPWLLYTASALLAACVLTRHIGVVLFPLCLLTLDRDRLRPLLIVAAPAVAGQMLWLSRNWLVAGSVDPREPETSLADVFNSLHDTAVTLGHWLIPHVHTGALLWVASLLVVAWIAAQLRVSGKTFEDRLARVCAWFVVIYLATIVAATSLSSISSVGNRFLSPVLVPLLIVAVLSIQRYFATAPPAARKLIEYGVLVWFLQWITAPNALVDFIL